MDMINVKINGNEYSVPKGSTILDAARAANIDIPTLCYLKGINEIGACRLCLVEVKGARGLMAACVTPANDGMEIFTNTQKVRNSRKTTLELMLSNHDRECLSCVRNTTCELQKLCSDYEIDDVNKYFGEKIKYKKDESTSYLVRDNNKCILCRRCVGACENLQGIGVIGANNRGFDTYIGSTFDLPLAETSCVNCGQCVAACPVGALYEKDSTAEVKAALEDPDKFVVVQAAPSVRVGLGECFGLPIGTVVEGQMSAALHRLGFDRVFDTNFSADLTILEEAHELIDRVQNGGALPLITSCSPGWIKYCEHYYPDLLPNVSSCKSPQQMFGAVVKTYYAETMGIPVDKIVSVSVMPCTAKKFECDRPDQDAAGVQDVDYSLTTRELGSLINEAGIDFVNLPEMPYDSPLGDYTGAGVIFGATGGVMEAALRTAVETITGEELECVEFTDVRGVEGVKEASYNVGGLEVNVAVASGLANAKKVLDAIRSGEKNYTFVEIMACPGGCVNGGGQPIVDSSVRNFVDVRALRAKGLYELDKNKPLRKSHENPEIIELYKSYFGEPGSEKAHHILHTKYVERKVNKDF